MCQYLFGQTIDGEGVVKIEPTVDSWCGRIAADQKEITRLSKGLANRLNWAIAFVLGAVAFVKFAAPIWMYLNK